MSIVQLHEWQICTGLKGAWKVKRILRKNFVVGWWSTRLMQVLTIAAPPSTQRQACSKYGGNSQTRDTGGKESWRGELCLISKPSTLPHELRDLVMHGRDVDPRAALMAWSKHLCTIVTHAPQATAIQGEEGYTSEEIRKDIHLENPKFEPYFPPCKKTQSNGSKHHISPEYIWKHWIGKLGDLELDGSIL